MSEPQRLKDLTSALPPELRHALEAAPAGPTEFEQRALLESLTATLGIALALPSAGAKLSAASGASALNALTWFGGGLTLGTVLSATALFSAPLLEPRPSIGMPAAPSVSSVARRVSEPAPSPSTPPDLDSDAGVRASPPALGSALRSPPREAHEQPTARADGEFSLLRKAQQSLRTDPQQALDLCAAHSTQFTSGVMAQEREMIGIEALLRLGRVQDAKVRASAFAKQFPDSAHRVRLEQLLRQTNLE